MKNLKYSKCLYFVAAIGLSGAAFGSALYPEDGSLGMNKWYVSKAKVSFSASQKERFSRLEKAFQAEGVEVLDFNYSYEYTQDISLFDQDGKFVFVNSGIGSEYLSGLSLGVLKDYGRYYEVTRVEKKHITSIGVRPGRTLSLMLEGGGVITGIDKNGDNYVLMRGDRFKDSIKYYQDVISPGSDAQAAIKYYAAQLEVPPDNFIGLTHFSSHLDSYMKALPGGKILLDDPEATLSVLEELAKKNPSESLLKRIEAEKEFRKGSKYSFYVKAINEIYDLLRSRFEVYRVPGRFNTYSYMRNYDGSRGRSFVEEDTNFFNGVSAEKKGGGRFFITNEAPGAPELEEYWESVLKDFGFDKSNVHFPGRYRPGNGLDCIGAPSL